MQLVTSCDRCLVNGQHISFFFYAVIKWICENPSQGKLLRKLFQEFVSSSPRDTFHMITILTCHINDAYFFHSFQPTIQLLTWRKILYTLIVTFYKSDDIAIESNLFHLIVLPLLNGFTTKRLYSQQRN